MGCPSTLFGRVCDSILHLSNTYTYISMLEWFKITICKLLNVQSQLSYLLTHVSEYVSIWRICLIKNKKIWLYLAQNTRNQNSLIL